MNIKARPWTIGQDTYTFSAENLPDFAWVAGPPVCGLTTLLKNIRLAYLGHFNPLGGIPVQIRTKEDRQHRMHTEWVRPTINTREGSLARIERILGRMKHAEKRTLFFIDEPCRGLHPEQAYALGRDMREVARDWDHKVLCAVKSYDWCEAGLPSEGFLVEVKSNG